MCIVELTGKGPSLSVSTIWQRRARASTRTTDSHACKALLVVCRLLSSLACWQSKGHGLHVPVHVSCVVLGCMYGARLVHYNALHCQATCSKNKCWQLGCLDKYHWVSILCTYAWNRALVSSWAGLGIDMHGNQYGNNVWSACGPLGAIAKFWHFASHCKPVLACAESGN